MNLELKATDMIVISIMDKQTGLYNNVLVTNRPRFSNDIRKSKITTNELLRIEIFPIGFTPITPLTFHSLEEFKNAIDW